MKSPYMEIELERLHESPFNPRKHFDEEKIAALARSIAALGVLQPLVVRQVSPTDCEIVCGHCRARAARQAGLWSVPGIVREMGDREVAELMLGENLQRCDLTPLEEAEGISHLVQAGATTAECAVVCGRSEGWVQLRLDLLGLPEPARAAVDERRLSIGAAAALRLVPEEERERALEEFLLPGFGGRPMGAREAAAWVEERFVTPARREEAWQEALQGFRCAAKSTVVQPAHLGDMFLSRGLPRHGFAMASAAVPENLLKQGVTMTWGTAANKLGVPWLVVPHFGLDDSPAPVALVNEVEVLMADSARKDAKQPHWFEHAKRKLQDESEWYPPSKERAYTEDCDKDEDPVRRLAGMMENVAYAAIIQITKLSKARDRAALAALISRFDMLASALVDSGYPGIMDWDHDAAMEAAREAEAGK